MIYTKKLPLVKQLQQLAGEVKDFPITGLGIAQYAGHLGYDEATIDFLNLFSKKLVFTSRSNFLENCSLLERLLKEERNSPPEHLRSPQG